MRAYRATFTTGGAIALLGLLTASLAVAGGRERTSASNEPGRSRQARDDKGQRGPSGSSGFQQVSWPDYDARLQSRGNDDEDSGQARNGTSQSQNSSNTQRTTQQHRHDKYCGHDDKGKDDQPTELSRARLKRLVERSLPGFDEEVLDVPDGKKWFDEVSFDRVLGALGEQPAQVPEGARLLRDERRTVKLDPTKGKLRYISRERTWSFDRYFQKPAFDSQGSLQRVVDTVRRIGLPLEEALEPQVETQMGAGARAGALRATDTFQMYRLVMLQRQIGKLPVYGSGLHAAVSHEGQVQRLQLSWPAFSLLPKLRLRERQLVVDDVVQKILDQQPSSETSVVASLVYAPQEDEKGGLRYVPTAHIAVMSLPTPYIVLVPIAETDDGDEEPVIIR